MKKVLYIWLAMCLCLLSFSAAAAEEVIVDIQGGAQSALTQDEDTPPQDETPLEDNEDAKPQDDGGPALRWTYPVSMTALHTEYNRLINRDNLLEEGDEPDDLVKMTVKRATSAAVYLRKAASDALQRMFEAALADGYTLYLKSGYRSYGTQKTTYSNRLASNNGKDDGVVAYPGASEHQTGLACDILNEDYAGRPRMTTDFSETAEARWMKENCASFGFILRYPDEKTNITGIIFEPWHFRYVGKEIAGYITLNNLTLEEFTDEWQLEVAEYLGKGGDIDAQMALELERQMAGPESYVLTDVLGEDGDNEVSISF